MTRILIVGATGNSGLALTRMALARGHEVTAFVRSADKLRTLLGSGGATPKLAIQEGTLSDRDALTGCMTGQDVAINAAGNATVDADYVTMVKSAIDAAVDAMGSGGRLWFFGGAAALDVPGMDLRAADIPLLPRPFRQHLQTLEHARATQLDWSMLCPGPMNPSETGKPHEGLRLSKDKWPVEGPGAIRLLRSIRVLAAFKRRMPEMVITYEDAAQVILDNLAFNSTYSRSRVGVALPAGLTGTKSLKF